MATSTSVTRTDSAGIPERRYEYDADRAAPRPPRSTRWATVPQSTPIPGLGVPTPYTDPNSVQTTTMRYDRFGRLREINRSDGSFEHISHGSLFGAQQMITNVSGGGHTYTQLDQRGRERERGVRSFDGRTAIFF